MKTSNLNGKLFFLTFHLNCMIIRQSDYRIVGITETTIFDKMGLSEHRTNLGIGEWGIPYE